MPALPVPVREPAVHAPNAQRACSPSGHPHGDEPVRMSRRRTPAAFLAGTLPPQYAAGNRSRRPAMPDPSIPGDGDLLFGAFGVVFAIVLTFVLLMFALIIGMTIYRAVRLRRQGVNPLTLETDLAVKVLKSDMLRSTPPRAARSKAERLAELDVLAANG